MPFGLFTPITLVIEQRRRFGWQVPESKVYSSAPPVAATLLVFDHQTHGLKGTQADFQF
jgi:hypothetical protein